MNRSPDEATSAQSDRGEHASLGSFALVPVLIAAGVGVAALLLTAGYYGYHRDELYFLASAKHLA